jgi:hypothetical protein
MEKISQIVILGEFLTLAETLRCFFLRSGGHASVHYQISTGFVLPITHAANLIPACKLAKDKAEQMLQAVVMSDPVS